MLMLRIVFHTDFTKIYKYSKSNWTHYNKYIKLQFIILHKNPTKFEVKSISLVYYSKISNKLKNTTKKFNV